MKYVVEIRASCEVSIKVEANIMSIASSTVWKMLTEGHPKIVLDNGDEYAIEFYDGIAYVYDGVKEVIVDKRDLIIDMIIGMIDEGYDKDKLYAIVVKHHGKRNPNDITIEEVADKIIADLNKLKEDKTTKE